MHKTKTVKRLSAIPVWGFGAVWLLWCLFLPMIRFWQLLLCAALSAAAYGILRIFFPPTVTEVDAGPDTGDAALDETLLQGREAVRRIQLCNDAIPDASLSAKLDEIQSLTGRIFAELERDPSKLSQLRRFLNYYLPTTLELSERYVHLQEAGDGENVTRAKAEIERLLDMVLVAFREQLDKLFAGEVIDITADVAVMEQMLAAAGLNAKNDL